MSDYKSEGTDQVSGEKATKDESSTDVGKAAMQGYMPLSDEIRMKLYDIQGLPPEQRGMAFGEYFNNAPKQVQEILQRNSAVDQYKTRIMDLKTGEEIIVRDDSEQMEE